MIASGLHGVVMRGPTTPVCRVGVPCSEPAAGATIGFDRNGRRVALVHVVTAGKPGTDEAKAAEELYAQLRAAGLDVLLDDRAAGAGEKFADAELLGCTLRLTVGRRSLESGAAESVRRRGQEQLDTVPLASPVEVVRDQWLASP